MMSFFVLVVMLGFTVPTYCQYFDSESDPVLYEAFHKALINDTTNLINLQSLFYPPEENSRAVNKITINICNFTVKKFSHNDSDENSEPGFIKCSSDCNKMAEMYCFNPLLWGYGFNMNFTLSSDSGTNSHARLADHIASLQPYLRWVDFSTYNYLSILSGTQVVRINEVTSIVLSIDELDTMPSFSEVSSTLELLLSWVRKF